MAIYNKNGTALTSAYDWEGTSLLAAYNVDGENVFSANPLTLKVMTYNCGQWFTGNGAGSSTENTSAVNHRALLQSIMTAQNPDILCIQEYWDVIGTTAVKDMLTASMPYYQEVNGKTNYFGHAIYSKYPISNFETSALSSTPSFKPVSESTNTNRFIDRCNITIDGKIFTVFNTHFGLDTSSRANNADWLLSCMTGKSNVIACGDFNTGCLSTTDADYVGVISKFISAGYHVANCGGFGFIKTWTDSTSTMTDGIPTDNIITSSNIIIESVYVDETKLTDGLNEKIDHLPLIANLQMT